MKPIKKFEEFVKEGTVKKQSVDKSRAEFLIKEAENDYNYLLEKIRLMKIKDSNSNDYVKTCYDILMELIRANMLLKGYNASGIGAHEAEVSYMRVLGFGEKDVQFTDQIRFFRNGMLYYGTMLDKEYAVKVLNFLKEIYPKLIKILKEDRRDRFMKIFAGIPEETRSKEVIVKINDKPYTWIAAYFEVKNNTSIGEEILKKLEELKLI